ncbi:HIT family protein [Furfurilactobacillus siliginis]|uniref:HIT family protein n=1 Tax=Furfurilactobacillus siliginis TaxID=348151 RepID=A0A0R2L6C4_9LACO|nr:HIT family protein [Furfurilactobacillus siliginis]KRN97203.1 hypothetical protein IV55_GL000126 [Furfurilactobacillus siliginis]GEK29324.1 HIT family protein [Furfurilactobacillus siliginis]
MHPDCPFCTKPDDQLILSNDLAKAFFDIHPMAPGHALIVPKAHRTTFFDATPAEQHAMTDLLDQVKTILDDQFHPRGYQIFSHVGTVAGQKVAHAHIHLVPVQ